jgi:Zn-dependent protease with chaperone function
VIVALGLLAGAAAAAWVIPRGLGAADTRWWDPVVLIVCWLLSMLGVVVAAATGVALLLTPTHGVLGTMLIAAHDCLDSLQHGAVPSAEETGGVLGIVVLLALGTRLAVVGVRGMRGRSRVRRRHLSALRIAGRQDATSPTTLWLAHDRPLAFSMAGNPGVVVATDGLTRHLDPAGVAAVLAHERAHLDGRHHQLVSSVSALRTVLAFLPLFERAPAAIRELVELAADVSAVRRHGVSAVRTALLGVSGSGVPDTGLAMGRDAIDARLERLDYGTPVPMGPRRVLSCAAAGLTAAVLPLATGATMLFAFGSVVCVAAGF